MQTPGPDGFRSWGSNSKRCAAAPAGRSCCCTASTRSIRRRLFSTCSPATARSSPPPRLASAIRRGRRISTPSTISSTSISKRSRRSPAARRSLIGFSFGGWLAAEIAAKCCHRIDKLILVDPLGIKISDRETPDILDVFNRSPDEVRRRSWHDPDRLAPDYNAMSDEALVVLRGTARRSASMPGIPTCTIRS